MQNTRKWLPYFIVILCAAAFFVYYLFPSDTVKKYITNHLNRAYPEIDIKIGYIKPVFPPGLRLYNVNFYHMNNASLEAEQIKIVPGMLSLFGSKTIFFFKGRTYQGILKGRGEFTKNGPARLVTMDGKLSGIRIKEISAIKQMTGHNMSGRLDGNFIYRSDKGSEGTLEASLVVSDGELDLSAPFLTLERIPFRKITAELTMKNRKIELNRCIIKGDQMDGSISGSVTLKQPPGKSYLKLLGTINAHPLFLEKLGKDIPTDLLPKKIFGKNGVHLRIYGTLDKPRLFLK